ncbi:MAG: DNA polymerase III subunit gamma/tau [Chloroflexia bacterium]
MGGQVLYRKWRPQRFEEVIGQEHVTRTLQRALIAGRIAHAYLFAGPRGTGKTTTARILAKAVNCTGEPGPAGRPCNICPACRAINEGRAVDLIEIDAASNRGIDEIRDLRERVRFAPSEFRYKVYIVDEVHMLTPEAFNALLKTLEEPPEHVIFILATTEPQRIPPTVLSRCQRFDFRRVRVADVVRRLEAIARAEGLDVTPEALELIARSATGSVRDAESLLDQLLVYGREGKLDVAEIQAVLGVRGSEQVARFVDALIARDLPLSLRFIQQLADDGVDLRQFNRELVGYLRDLLFLAATQGAAEHLDVTAEVLERMRAQVQRTTAAELTAWVRRFSQLDAELRAGWYGQLPIELAVVESVLPVPAQTPAVEETTRPASGAVSSTRTTTPQRAMTRPAVSAPREAPSVGSEVASRPAPEPPPPPSDTVDLAYVRSIWPQVVEGVRPRNPSVQALLHASACQPIAVEGRVVVLGFRYAFHKGKVEEVQNRRLVEEVLSRVLQGNYGIRCVLQEGDPAANRRRQAADRLQAQRDPRVQAAANIFNARIVDVQPTEEEEPSGG